MRIHHDAHHNNDHIPMQIVLTSLPQAVIAELSNKLQRRVADPGELVLCNVHMSSSTYSHVFTYFL